MDIAFSHSKNILYIMYEKSISKWNITTSHGNLLNSIDSSVDEKNIQITLSDKFDYLLIAHGSQGEKLVNSVNFKIIGK